MKLNFLKHRWQKNVFKFVLIPVTVILILAVVVNRYWSPILAAKVKDVVLNSSDSLYTADFSDAELHILRGKIILYNIRLKPDTAVYNKKKRLHLAPNTLVELSVKRLVINHAHPFSLYFHKKLNIGQIILNEPRLNVSYQLNHTKDTVVKDHRTAWQRISKSLKSIHIGNILLNDVNLNYEDYSGNKVAISKLKELNLSANDLLIDSATQTDKSRLLYCKDIITELNNYTGQTPSGLYTYKIKHLKLSTFTSKLNIEGLALQAAKASTFFDKTQKDRLGLLADSVQLSNFDYLNYHKYRTISASSLKMSGGKITAFTNPVKTKDTVTNQVKTFPNMMLGRLKLDLRIDTVKLRRMDVIYNEFNNKSQKTGTVEFDNTSATILNLTNNPSAIAKNNITTATIVSYFMNRGRLDAQFKFTLNDDNAPFSYKGSLGPMDFTRLNPATMPLAMVKMTSGKVKKFSFDIDANSKVFKGKVDFLYNDLKVVLLKPDTANDRLKRKTIISIFANLFVIKHNNPDDKGKLTSSYVIFKRPKDFGFWKTVWKTLLTGIKPCIGLDEKSQKATKDRIDEHNKNKAERLKNKAERQKRRAEKKKLMDEGKF
ncbi:hypothetical protein [Mucilaginibacter celer]|uniref:DUF748 domain-containing protein n=1 Tax=Mucilaginibacter celer TaxID=2305508 RepID=A0A494VRC9_9SPHI|nr:hypothetical protein [Mucilaginibacter celer]AYL97464.1 hypothetical protein HYN43_020125 [Mucilaginibacter celer]